MAAAHPDVRMGLNQLALLYRLQGKYAFSEQVYRCALEIYQQTKDRGTSGTQMASEGNAAASLQGLAKLYHTQEEYLEAEPLYQQALAGWKRRHGPDHPVVGQTLFELADVYDALERYREAERVLQQSVAIWEKQGWDSDLAATLTSYAALLRKTNRPGEAGELEKRVKALREKPGRMP